MTLTTEPKAKAPKEELSFGTSFTDHMLEVDWDSTNGWGAPKISPYHQLSVDPAASVFHYALEVRPSPEHSYIGSFAFAVLRRDEGVP